MSAFYVGTFVSGMCALIFQVAWQRYLMMLVGSEARSISLVVGVFLFGLAMGYRYWGNRSERLGSRRRVLATYGAIELAIGAYAFAFPWLFARVLAVGRGLPDHLGVDLALTSALLLAPTFLMGATIPLLTKALPERPEQANDFHARVYAVNTLGACAGAWIGGFWLVPALGLRASLGVAGVFDVVVGAVFLVGARRVPAAQGLGAAERPAMSIPNRYPAPVLLLFAAASGAITILFEVLCVRVLSLVVGSAHYVFPAVVGAFVLGLAVGSLTLARGGTRRLGASRLLRECALGGAWFALLYACVPFWINWHVGLRKAFWNASYEAYLVGLVVVATLALLPGLVFLGRLLPLTYALVDKKDDDYGRICGGLYFVNTLGTVVGSCLLGHYALGWLSLDAAFKLGLGVLAWVVAVGAWYGLEGRARWRAAGSALVALAVVAWLPRWDRTSYTVGMFRTSVIRST
ncbi:MAG: fused MFS/spermidine synthase, partial [Deltaproteobacteria bacterium]|nr:fused MFS/spermidine synthase [Deltaproteobacteria bacterium]